MPRVAIENHVMYDINVIDAAKTPAGLMDISSYISGYVDGEGCFTVSFSPRRKLRTGWEVRPSPLMFSKRRDFDTFAVICRLLEGRKQLSREGLREIATLAVTMNPSGKRRFQLTELIDYTST